MEDSIQESTAGIYYSNCVSGRSTISQTDLFVEGSGLPGLHRQRLLLVQVLKELCLFCVPLSYCEQYIFMR